MKRLITSCLLFICYFVSESFAQTDSIPNVSELELNGHVGRLVKIHGEYPENDISSLIEFHIAQNLNGKKSWHNDFKKPSAGLSLLHAQFGNQDILGQALGIIPTMRFENWRNKTRWSWRAGLGIAGFNKPYDAVDNPRNLVIGSRFTNMTMLRIEMSKPLSKKMRYNIGLSYTHCSDAHIAVPNIGANLISITAGISFCNQPEMLNTKKAFTKPQRAHEKWDAGAHFIFGMHEFQGTIRPVDGTMYFVYGENLHVSKKIRPGRNFSMGLNHQYYTSYHDYILSQELFPPGTKIRNKSHNIVAYLGYEWQYGRTALLLEAGLNLYNPFISEINKVWDLPKHGLLYVYTANKIGYRFYFTYKENPNAVTFKPYISIAVKTNGGTADFLEFAIGTKIIRAKIRS